MPLFSENVPIDGVIINDRTHTRLPYKLRNNKHNAKVYVGSPAFIMPVGLVYFKEPANTWHLCGLIIGVIFLFLTLPQSSSH